MVGSDAGLPRWDLGPIYPSFDAGEYSRDCTLLEQLSASLLEELVLPFPSDAAQLAPRVLRALNLLEEAGDLSENLEAYANAVYTTDTGNARALAAINALEALSLPLAKAVVIFRERLAGQAESIRTLAASVVAGNSLPGLSGYGFFLLEQLELASKQMPSEMEDLANDLSRSGGDAWSRLHEAITSTATALWDPSTGERKTAIELRNLAHDSDRAVRERAFRAEQEAWKAVELPLAASLNGVKGFYLSLNKRRGWAGALERSCFQARMEKGTLDALIHAMEGSLPVFRRYLKAKARLLGVERCAFFDLFAPAPATGRHWSYPEAKDFIIDRFSGFTPAFGNFARHAFEFNWIDAEPRAGKVGGAYCTDFPIKGDSRILCNFEGSFSSVSTLAHELGHAWHHELIKDLPRSQAAYPMTLAETASIFAETVVLESALAKATPAERLGLIEMNLQDSCQVVVDILSRFYFERSIFERREKAELSPDELSALMLDAQKATYGDALDPDLLHPYMWAVKGHYYIPSLAFYNFPYAFGLLFALGLYARYRKEGPAFAADYQSLLRMTGRASAEDVARSAGFDISGAAFWEGGIALIAERTAEFERLVKEKP